MKFNILKLFFLLLPCLVHPLGMLGSGTMQVRNFPYEIYRGGPQNWKTVQDNRGRVYIANRDGMLAFDGGRWSKYVLPNFTAIRTLLYDEHEDRIYAGGTEEFGFSVLTLFRAISPTRPLCLRCHSKGLRSPKYGT